MNKIIMLIIIISAILTGCQGSVWVDSEVFEEVCKTEAINYYGFDDPHCNDCGVVQQSCLCYEVYEGNLSINQGPGECFSLVQNWSEYI